MAIITHTIGSGGDYADFDLYIDALNAGTIGGAGDDMVGEVISDVVMSTTPSTIAPPVDRNSVTLRSAAGFRYRYAKTNTARMFTLNTTVPVIIEDLDMDANGQNGTWLTDGMVYAVAAGTDLTVKRCIFRGLRTTYRPGVVSLYNNSGTTTLNMYSCLVYDNVSTRDVAADQAALIYTGPSGNTSVLNLENNTFDENTSTAPVNSTPMNVTRTHGGSTTLNAKNNVITRIICDGAAGVFSNTVENLTTNASFHASETAITSIDETVFADAAARNYTPIKNSDIHKAGTTLVTDAQYDFNNNVRAAPWDVGAVELFDSVDRARPLGPVGRNRLAPAMVGRTV
jgi:hypothetical protein